MIGDTGTRGEVLKERAERAEGGGSAMAGQQLNPQMIPQLGVSGLAALPPGKLASEHDFLRLLFHQQHYNLTGFQGVPSICCKVDSKTKRTRCKEASDLTTPWSETRAGCIQSGNPCLMAKIKKNWEEAHPPTKDLDLHILRSLVKIKTNFDKKKRHGFSEGEVESLKTTTVNLAPSDWESRILADRLTSAAQHLVKINIMRDYLSAGGTRFVQAGDEIFP